MMERWTVWVWICYLGQNYLELDLQGVASWGTLTLWSLSDVTCHPSQECKRCQAKASRSPPHQQPPHFAAACPALPGPSNPSIPSRSPAAFSTRRASPERQQQPVPLAQQHAPLSTDSPVRPGRQTGPNHSRV